MLRMQWLVTMACAVGLSGVLRADSSCDSQFPGISDTHRSLIEAQKHFAEAAAAAMKNIREIRRSAEASCCPVQIRDQIIAQLARVAAQTPENARSRLQEAVQKYLSSEPWKLAPRREKAAYLGVSCSQASAALRQQLKLPRGVGLVVDNVEKGSPADEAGLQQFDVLRKLDDQILVNTEQLAVLVRLRKPGDEVTLTFIRQGKESTTKAKLVEKELPVLELSTPLGRTMDLLRSIEMQPVWGDGGIEVTVGPWGRTTTAVDDELTMTVTELDGKKTLEAVGKDGQILFSGPVDTEEQRKALPRQLAERLERLMDSVFTAVKGRPGSMQINIIDRAGQRRDVRHITAYDPPYSIEIRATRNGDGHPSLILKVRDEQDNVLYDGPIGTEQQLQAIPQEVRRRISSPAWRAMLQELRQPTAPQD